MMSDEVETAEIETLPLDAWHRARGARMVEFAGYHMPIQYEGIIAEHLWTRESAGLFDVSHMGQLMLSGEGAAVALETVVPGEITALGEGRMRYSLLLAEDGGILDDLMVTTTPMGIYIVVNGAVKWEDIGYLRENLPDDITLNHMEDRALLALQGPKAVDALKRVVPGAQALYFMEAGSFLWGHTPLWISRSGYTGEDGFEISVPADEVEALAKLLCEQAEVKPIGLGARDSLRLEAGLPLYGHDLDPAIDPVQGDLTFAINKRRREQGGFAGAERILGALANGPAKKRVGLKIEGKMPAREGAPIFNGASQIGVLTSGGFAPSLGFPIAMGYVTRDFAATGTPLEIEVRGKRIAATVTSMPFIPNRYHRKGKPA
jgi:aminomethyltransferase